MPYDGRIYRHRKKYHTPPEQRTYFKKDNDEAVRQIELYMVEYCESRKLDWSTINKYELAKKIGVYKEYYDALIGHRIHR